ncbi:hypothetical protein FGO68_gene12936 [Halteria grandinella]|uniref:Uncharacterized protein n=1 Tax=Halteria grandinella TaxID=5974 RepID=A0A8J8NXG8_HALGN|nr:hypothetical protein FGO68_gene12936 [Halteria grandinella]
MSPQTHSVLASSNSLSVFLIHKSGYFKSKAPTPSLVYSIIPFLQSFAVLYFEALDAVLIFLTECPNCSGTGQPAVLDVNRYWRRFN